MAKIARLSDASSKGFEREASPVEGQSQQKYKKRRKSKGKKRN